MLVMSTLSGQAHAMGNWNKIVKKLFAAATLYGLGSTYDHQHSEQLDFVDVSTPGNPVVVQECVDFDDSAFETSVTKLQLENDLGLKGPVLFAQKMGKNYSGVVNTVLFSHFWVFLPTLRNKLANLVMHISCDEVEQRSRDNLCLVHGTGQAASMLLRTIFHEVFNEKQVENFVKLRDDSVVEQLAYYDHVDDYYDEQFDLAPKIENIMKNPAGGVVSMGTFTTLFDHGVARNHLLSTNFGFFGNSSWLIHGYKESSAEFLTRPCSWGYQGLDYLVVLSQFIANPIVPLGILFFVVRDVVKNPEMINQVDLLIDKHGKGLDDSFVFENIFKEYGVQERYSHYEKELNQMKTIANAGLVQLFIPQELAQRRCYISQQLGIREPGHTPGLLSTRYLGYSQARILLHPDLCPENGVSMKFYLLGEQAKINAMLARMYEIAEEVKSFKKY